MVVVVFVVVVVARLVDWLNLNKFVRIKMRLKEGTKIELQRNISQIGL